MQTIETYLAQKWKETVRYTPQDEGMLIGLPYTYTVPCADGMFNEIYYWDTYFTNKGLLAAGEVQLAKDNCRNMLYLVGKFGYMPNGNLTIYLGRSQPPYLAMMVWDVYAATADRAFLTAAYPVLQKEYAFWEKARMTESGLNRHFADNTAEECAKSYAGLRTRVRSPFSDPEEGGRNLLAEAESGWDFTARFGGRCAHFNPVDLNSNLYRYEVLFAKTERELALSDGAAWEARALRRKQRIGALCYDPESKTYRDYDFTERKRSSLYSAAMFWPYFMGVAESGEGLAPLLEKLEAPYGIFTAEKSEERYQWGYPNVWAPCMYAAVVGCENYGYSAAAARLAHKYIALIEKNYEETGKLWEKYNALDGNTQSANEYATPEMMGWTAGVYTCLKQTYGNTRTGG